MNYSFNELSLEPVENMSYDESIIVTNTFVELLHELLRSGNKKILTTEVFFTDTHIHAWLENSNVKMSNKQFLRTVWNSRIYTLKADDYSGHQMKVTVNSVEKDGFGCLLAHVHKIPTISMKTQNIWHSDEVCGTLIEFNEHDDLIETDVSVRNIANQLHIKDLDEKETDAFYASIRSAHDLWNNKEKLFPNLIFCDNVRDQLISDGNGFHVTTVMKKLKIFNDYFSTYDGVFNHTDFGCGARYESKTVQNNPDFRNARRFKKPDDGIEDYFYWHIGFDSIYSYGRIHFLPCDIQKKCYIGYIGRHLPTGRS